MILTGPNCAGTISPGKAMMGIMPGHIYMKGKVGLIGRSGTLGYEAASQMKELGIGISTAVGIGGDPINGSSFVEILKHFEKDDETEAVLIIGEIGGPQEAEAADYFKNNMSKPMAAYVAGLTAPPGRLMGHAGAIVNSSGESAAEKVIMLKDVGILVAPTPSDMGITIAKLLKANWDNSHSEEIDLISISGSVDILNLLAKNQTVVKLPCSARFVCSRIILMTRSQGMFSPGLKKGTKSNLISFFKAKFCLIVIYFVSYYKYLNNSKYQVVIY